MPRSYTPVILLVALATTVFIASCSDETGPNTPIEARFAVAPVFQSAAATAIDIASIRFVLTRVADDSIARDTVVQIAAGQDSVSLELTVPVLTPGETFLLTLAMVDASGDTVFRGGPTEVTPSTTGGDAPVVAVIIVYVGIGFDAASVMVTPATASTFFGEAVVLTAVALDSVGEPIPGTPIVWSTLDAAQATVPNPDSGRVVAGTARGTARIVAELLTGPRDTSSIFVQPVPNSIVADQGNNQTGPIDLALAQPIVARVLAVDGLGVEGIDVVFAVTGGGGSLSAATLTTDATGRVTTNWTLGPVSGAQTVEATTVRLAGSSAVFSATGLSARATQLLITAGNNQSDTVAATLPLALGVQALDSGGLPFPNDTVVFTVATGGGSVTLDTVATDTGGNASTTWTLGTAPGPQVVQAKLITNADSADFAATADAGTAVTLGFVGQPTNAFPFDTLAPIVITASDQFGNLASGFTGTVDLALIVNPNGGTLLGQASRAALGGQVTFTGLSIDNTGSGYVIEAVSAGLTPDTSVAFDILVPAGVVFWNNAAGGNWSNGTNWSTGSPPGTTETAVIDLDGTYTVTLDVDPVLGALTLGGSIGTQTLNAVGRTLTLNGTSLVSPTGVLQLANTTIGGTGSLTNSGLLDVRPGTSNINVGLTQAGTITQNGNNGDANLVVATGFTNAGTMELTGTSWSGVLTITAGTLTNAVTGTIRTVAGVDNRITGNLDNQGTITVVFPLRILNTGSTFTSTAGTIDVSGGVTFEIQNGTTVLGTGTGLTGTGTIDFTGTPAITLLTNLTLAAAGPTVAFGTTNAVTVNGPGTLINQRALSLQNDVINAPLDNQATGTITVLPGTSNLNGAVTQAGTITQNGNNGDANLVVATGFTNTGTMELTGTSWSGVLTITAGTLTNGAAGTIQTITGVNNSITGNLDNQGTISIAGTTTGILTIAGPLVLQGTSNVNIDVNGLVPGTEHDQLVVTGAMTLAGTINVTGSFAVAPPILTLIPIITYASQTGAFAVENGIFGTEIIPPGGIQFFRNVRLTQYELVIQSFP